MNRAVNIFPTKAELVQAAAEKVIATVNAAIYERGRCALALAGGGTPRDVYALLAADGYRRRVDWSNVFLFWGDERCVPPDHPDSNFRMVNESLLSHIAIPTANVFRMKGEMEPAAAASEYEQHLEHFFGAGLPPFDLILLGLGEDGHTASLFPGTSALDERKRNVAAVFVPKFNAYRVTLTLPVINHARQIMFIVAGKSKSQIVPQVLKSDQPTKELPASLVQPQNGHLNWMLDAEAAKDLRL
jgi:6-phosphogluconolactonase